MPSSNSIKSIGTPKLTRSQSVEKSPILRNDHSGFSNSRASNYKKLTTAIKVKMLNPPKNSHESKSLGTLSTSSAGLKTRRPFSFSQEFKDIRPYSHSEDCDDLQQGSEDHDEDQPKKQQAISKSPRSPRVHFADFIDTNDETAETEIVQRKRSASLDETIYDVFHDVPEREHRDVHDNNQGESQVGYLENDKLMIEKTDDIIMDVARFITDIKNSRARELELESWGDNVPPATDQKEKAKNSPDYHEEQLNELDFVNSSLDSVEGLDKVTCPSVIFQASARSNLDSFRESDLFKTEELLSRPTSATFMRSVSNEDIHGRISLTLRMIEQEEQRKHLHIGPSSDPSSVEDVGLRKLESNISEFCGSLASVSLWGTRPESQSSIISSKQHDNQENRLSAKINRISTPNSSLGMTKSLNDQEAHAVTNSKKPDPVTGQSYNDNVKLFHETAPSVIVRQIEAESTEKSRKIFSFLDEVEKNDREALLGLQYERAGGCSVDTAPGKYVSAKGKGSTKAGSTSFLEKIDGLIRKGSVELAKEQIILERKLEESHQRIQVLEETLIHQRELNMRNLKNSENDLKKRLRLQKEEFDVSFSRNEALINEMAAEKRILIERCDKLMKHFDETEEKYKEQIKSLQQKHLDEIKRLRKAQINAENAKKQQWVGNKTNEIREMTVKGLEPEVQRIIQRHQQEMSEMRAWHFDEIREIEERYQRKLNMQMQEMREKISKEAEDIISKEKELANARYESALKQREEELESLRRRLLHELQEERDRFSFEESKVRSVMQDNLKKIQIKGELELENIKQEYESKIANIERKHSNELQCLKDIHETEKESLAGNTIKKYETMMKEQELQLMEAIKIKMDTDVRERERKLRDEFDKIRREDEAAAETRMRRLQDKFSSDLQDMDQSEKELKIKLSQTKSQLMLLEEQVYSLKASLSLKEKQNTELQESNFKMMEERANLTSVIRREFSMQIDTFEEELRSMKSTMAEVQAKHKLELEHKQQELEKLGCEKDAELDKIATRVQQTIARKDETIQGLQKQIEKLSFQVQHVESLLEEQRRNIVDSMTNKAKRK